MQQVYAINPKMLEQINTPAYRDYITTIVRNKKTLQWLKENVSAGA